jgi:hypothetical protein
MKYGDTYLAAGLVINSFSRITPVTATISGARSSAHQ